MNTLLDGVQNFIEKVSGNPQTSEELLKLKRELANNIVDKLEKENPDLLISLDKELVAEYLVHEGIMDGLKDSVFENTVLKISQMVDDLKAWREEIKNIGTPEELNTLKAEILGRKLTSKQKVDSPVSSSQEI